MKWLFALLVLANMALYLWASGLERHKPDANGSSRPAVNEKSMRLLSEVTLGDAAQETVELSALLAEQCVRVGPFEQDETFNKATEVFDSLDLSYDRQTVNAREVQRFRVQTGPFDSPAAAEARIAELQSQGIDAYLIQNSKDEDIITLKLFPQESAAQELVTELAGKGIDARISREIDSLGPFRWLEAAYSQSGTLTDLRATDWGEPGVQVHSEACEKTDEGRG